MITLIVTLLLSLAQAEVVSEKHRFELDPLTQTSGVIWGFDFLPDERILFSERSGLFKIWDPKSKQVVTLKLDLPVFAKGQGGLLDVRVHPNFKANHLVYATFSEPVGDKATTSLVRFELIGSEVRNFKKLFSAAEPNQNTIHFGSRLEFDGAGHVFMTVGDRDDRHRAQKLEYHNGKILRLNEDGTPSQGNPFAQNPGARPEIWSLGHRSPQGLVYVPETKQLWEAEMGPRGGDEVNLIEPKNNYGWPVITYGREYWGPKIGEGTAKPGLLQPIAYWVPSISPSGMTYYGGNKFPLWKGNLFLGTLSGQHLRRLEIKSNRVVHQEELLKDRGWRFRCVRSGPDGLLYFSTDDGRLVRLLPKP